MSRPRMCTSAVPSVNVNVRYRTKETFTPVGCTPQVLSRIGFPSGCFAIFPKIPDLSANVRVATATGSVFVTKAVKFADASFRRRINDSRPIFAAVPTGGVPAAGALGRLFLSEVPA